MPADVIMPALGMAQETGKVVRWLKQDGELVAKGEPLLEVETDKATVVYDLSQNGGGTHFHYTNEYALPGGVAGKLAGAAVVGASGHEANKTLKRLKRLVESKSS